MFCIHFGSSTNLPPVLCMIFGGNSESSSDNCLLDTSSEWTNLSSEVLKSLSSLGSVGLDCDFSLSTLLGDCYKCFLETDVRFDCPLSLPVLVDKNRFVKYASRNWKDSSTLLSLYLPVSLQDQILLSEL